MTALLILIVLVCVLYALRSVGLFPKLVFSWDLIWRIFVYLLLALGVLGVLAKAWSIAVLVGHLPMAWLISPSQDPLLDAISTVIYALALWGVFRWKKWGAYLIFARLAFTISLQIFVYHSLSWHLAAGYTGSDNLFADVDGAISWLIAFFFTWKYFT